MINGCPLLDAELPVINGIEINNIKDIYKLDPNLLPRFFEAASDADQRRWVLLNTALFIDGLYLKITRSTATPLLIQHLSTADGRAGCTSARHH